MLDLLALWEANASRKKSTVLERSPCTPENLIIP
jgi:hypothetical protein